MSYSHRRYSLYILLSLVLPCFSAYRTSRKRKPRQPEIFQVINDGDFGAMMRVLRDAGEDTLSVRGPEGETPLHVAVSLGNDWLVKLLLNAGADVTAMEEDHYLPLTIAA